LFAFVRDPREPVAHVRPVVARELVFIFDKFRRASTAGGHDGWGLGLYVSKRIVEAHGGRIGVASMRGAGSQFFFDLPAT
jgi:signal transduction histidine kinase